MKTLHWFRDDLRIEDNTALNHASSLASNGCIAVYFITPQTWRQHDMAAVRVDFILRGLALLKAQLASYNILLVTIECPSFKEIPAHLLALCQQTGVQTVFANKQYEVNEIALDKAVASLLEEQGIAFHRYHDQCIIPPAAFSTQKGEAYTVFTPFKNAWLQYLLQHPVALLPPVKKQNTILSTALSTYIPSQITGFDNQIPVDLWPAGAKAAAQRLSKFIEESIQIYKEARDIPSTEGTSGLSPYLATGMISARQCLLAAQSHNNGQLKEGQTGIACWINELIWRDFYKHVLSRFPRVSKNLPFKLATNTIQWDDNPKLLLAWQTGQTGFPIVDAAMRQLVQTGWMHNRLRMITAMFLSKLLWIDWRLGERFFMQHLIDGDLAANNGGWQWSASTGTDAVPYFRIFNPLLQSEKYDPDGTFIKQYCPELRELDKHTVHAPFERGKLFANTLHYPQPIIDYKMAREKAIKLYKEGVK